MAGDDDEDDDHLMGGDDDDVKDILRELNIGGSSRSMFLCDNVLISPLFFTFWSQYSHWRVTLQSH